MNKAHTWDGTPFETKHITEYKAPRHLEFAHNLATRLGKVGISTRIGKPVKVVVVTETISEKTRRVLSECDAILCK
jgi:hypothetical protein